MYRVFRRRAADRARWAGPVAPSEQRLGDRGQPYPVLPVVCLSCRPPLLLAVEVAPGDAGQFGEVDQAPAGSNSLLERVDDVQTVCRDMFVGMNVAGWRVLTVMPVPESSSARSMLWQISASLERQ